MPMAATGVAWLVSCPSPISPSGPYPQHETLPIVSSAQTCCSPDVIDATFVRPVTATGTFEPAYIWPLPRLPYVPLPQHSAVWSCSAAQSCPEPTPMEIALVIPVTATGTFESAEAP